MYVVYCTRYNCTATHSYKDARNMLALRRRAWESLGLGIRRLAYAIYGAKERTLLSGGVG